MQMFKKLNIHVGFKNIQRALKLFKSKLPHSAVHDTKAATAAAALKLSSLENLALMS
jgi:hypothetical protein